MDDHSDLLLERPLASVRFLASKLGYKVEYLEDIANRAGSRYRSFELKKKSGGVRKIDCPTSELEKVQRRIHERILSQVTFPRTMNGGIRGRSTRDNAAPHIGRPVVGTIDLKDCYPRTNFRRVYKAFERYLGCTPPVASLLTKLTTYHKRVPQGAPNSPLVVNLTLLPLDRRLSQISRKHGLRQSSFVDDIALSGRRVREAMGEVAGAVQGGGHKVAWKKKKIRSRVRRQEVPGEVVNRKHSAGQERIRSVRQSIRMLLVKGDFSEKERRSVLGKIAHVKRVCSDQGNALERLFYGPRRKWPRFQE